MTFRPLGIDDYLDMTKPISAISAILKGFIIGPIWSGDFEQIEPRVLNKLAGQEDYLDIFRAGTDPYMGLASLATGKPVGQVTKKDSVDSRGKVVKSDRFLGKQGELSCGYGVGPQGFINNMKEKFDVDIEFDMAERIVKSYRNLHWKVVKLWKGVEKLAKAALSSQSQVWLSSTECPGISFRCYKTWLCLKLPSKRILWYFEPELMAGDYGLEIWYWGRDVNRGGMWTRVKTYGGKLVENITQALARDVMAESMLRLEEFGEELLFTVHDEIVGRHLGTSPSAIESIMKEQPSFWSGLPLAVKVTVSNRYQK